MLRIQNRGIVKMTRIIEDYKRCLREYHQVHRQNVNSTGKHTEQVDRIV